MDGVTVDKKTEKTITALVAIEFFIAVVLCLLIASAIAAAIMKYQEYLSAPDRKAGIMMVFVCIFGAFLAMLLAGVAVIMFYYGAIVLKNRAHVTARLTNKGGYMISRAYDVPFASCFMLLFCMFIACLLAYDIRMWWFFALGIFEAAVTIVFMALNRVCEKRVSASLLRRGAVTIPTDNGLFDR